MDESRRILEEIVGESEDGDGKALSCLMVQKRIGDREPEVCDTVYLSDAVLSVSFTADFTVVDLHFSDHVDYDYLKAGELCRRFTELVSVDPSRGDQEDYALILSIVPKGEYDVFFVGLDAIWSFMPEKPEGMCSVIRMIFVRDKFNAYEFAPDAVGEIVEEAAAEIEETESF